MDDSKVKLTIYTPTYNRINLLSRVYKSLKAQTSYRFIWMIIDDGSTDGTEKTVKAWIEKEKSFEIKYYYKKNGGVHTARDYAYHCCFTELIMGVDSDDWVLPNTVENIYSLWEENQSGEYAGIIGTSIYEDGTRICPPFPKNLKYATFQEFAFKYKLKSDSIEVLRVDIMKSLDDAPSFEGENLIGEEYKMIQIPEIPFIISDTPFQVVEYQNAGYSAEAYMGVFKNPNGFRADYCQFMLHAKYLRPRIRGTLGYIVCSFILHDWQYISKSPRIIETVLLTPAGILAYIFIKNRSKRSVKIRVK